MPRIPDRLLWSVFYLYDTVEDAQAGKNCGGTGFLVSVPSAKFEHVPGAGNSYLVSNRHVVERGASVARLNKIDGTTAIFETEPSDWVANPNGADVAVLLLLVSDPSIQSLSIGPLTMATKEAAKREDIGVGDDLFMIGRFVDQDGGLINTPSARFGCISAMPFPVVNEHTARKSDVYLADMRSRSGFSGSPVFVYRNPGSNLRQMHEDGQLDLSRAVLMLLGVHCGQYKEVVHLTKDDGERSKMTGLSGMNMVVPAWEIVDTLNVESLQKARQARDQEWVKHFGVHKFESTLESTSDDAQDGHKERFNDMLSRAVKH